MGKCNTSLRGFSSGAIRKLRVDSYAKKINRQNNLKGCTARSERINNAQHNKS